MPDSTLDKPARDRVINDLVTKLGDHEKRIRDLENQVNRWRGISIAVGGFATMMSIASAVIAFVS